MIRGMLDPQNPQLAAEASTLRWRTPTAQQQDEEFGRTETYNYAIWDVEPGRQDFGYQWSSSKTDLYNGHPAYPTSQLGFYIRRHEVTQKLMDSNVGTVLRAAGVIVETTNIESVGIKRIQTHMHYPLTRTFVENVNPALEAAGRSFRFEVHEGGAYPAVHAMTRFAEDGVLPLGTHPHYNNHDVTYHSFGWLALPDSIVMDGFQQDAQKLMRINDLQERAYKQVEYMGELEQSINVIYATSANERSLYAGPIGKIANIPTRQVQAACQQHLYGQTT